MPTQRDPDAPQPPEANAPRAQIEPLTPPHDSLLVPLLHGLTQPLIDAGLAHGKLPRLRTDEWLDAHPDQQLAHLLLCGIAYVMSPPQATVAALLKSTSCDIAAGYHADNGDPLSLTDRLKERARQAEQRADAEKRARLAAEARLRALEQHHTPRAS